MLVLLKETFLPDAMLAGVDTLFPSLGTPFPCTVYA
jgi:hypothetical protein